MSYMNCMWWLGYFSLNFSNNSTEYEILQFSIIVLKGGKGTCYLSPCWRLRKKSGYSCLHAAPITPVSSSREYLEFERRAFPAKKSLQCCIKSLIKLVKSMALTNLSASIYGRIVCDVMLNHGLVQEHSCSTKWPMWAWSGCFLSTQAKVSIDRNGYCPFCLYTMHT